MVVFIVFKVLVTLLIISFSLTLYFNIAQDVYYSSGNSKTNKELYEKLSSVFGHISLLALVVLLVHVLWFIP